MISSVFINVSRIFSQYLFYFIFSERFIGKKTTTYYNHCFHKIILLLFFLRKLEELFEFTLPSGKLYQNMVDVDVVVVLRGSSQN